MQTRQMTMKRALGLALAILLTGMVFAPTSALAVTGAGTKITNTASVTWSGAAAPSTDSADVLVTLLPAAPTIAYVSAAPAVATTTGVGAGTGVAVTYTVTSGANGTDTYTLDLSSVDNAQIGAPAFNGGNPSTVSLGASMVLYDASSTNTIIISGVAANHGLAAGETLLIGATRYTINTVTNNATDSEATITLYNLGTTTDASISVSAGDPVYEQRTLVFNMTTGTFVAAPTGNGQHDLTLTATSDQDGTKIGTAADPSIIVALATLTIDKVADKATAAPLEIITYTITVSNAPGAPSAAAVTVTDATPDFTSYVSGSGSYSIDGGASVAIADGALASGVNIGSLAGGSSAVITFQVRVD